MHFRERCARWFEIVVPRSSLARAVELIAGTGAAELDAESEASAGLDLSDARPALEEFRRLERAYSNFWPVPDRPQAHQNRPIEAALGEAIERLRAWESDARPYLRELEEIARDHESLAEVRGLVLAMHDDDQLDLGELVAARPPATARLYLLDAETPTPRAARSVLRLRRDTGLHAYLLVVGPEEDLQALDDELRAAGGRAVALPDWLQGTPEDALRAIDRRLAELDGAAAERRTALDELGARHDVAHALGQVRRLDWMVEHLPAVQVSEYLARITGWTDAEDARVLTRPLDDAGIPAVIGFPEPPAGREPPRLTHNPVWARPFELFMQLMGTPGRYETDPSRLLAFIAPVLFGYMFGDVGQGAVLIVAGLFLRRYLPILAMLIPGGAMAIVFGLLFGSVFALEGVIGPYWVNPIEEPLPVLVVPLFGGAGLIVLGLLLNAVAASRRRRFGPWLRMDAGLVVTYAGALAAGLWPEVGLPAVLTGLAWYLVGCACEWRHGAAAVLGHMGELLERLLQLAVNTLSFLRVGAFALAHTGLSVAVMALAESAPGIAGEVVVLVIGNALILVLEGLVVSVQTTRLILFEFFIRFFRAEGRPFRPMSPPLGG